MVQFREATLQDFPQIAKLGRLMHEESSYSGLEFSESRLYVVFELYIREPDRLIILAERDGEILGLYAGYVSKYYFSEELVANDIAWFVVKEKRGSSIGLKLLNIFERWAKAKGVSEIRIKYSTDINPKAFDSLMSKRGYSNVGANYRLENLDV
jgi:GNAT superfamily N-acetyltransferase